MLSSITLPNATVDIDVKLDDGDIKRVYRPRVMTRSAKRVVNAAQRRMQQLAADLPDDGDVSDDQEDAMMRAVCDVIDAILTTSNTDAPTAGSLLYDGWVAEDITEDQVVGLVNKLGAAVTPNPT